MVIFKFIFLLLIAKDHRQPSPPREQSFVEFLGEDELEDDELEDETDNQNTEELQMDEETERMIREHNRKMRSKIFKRTHTANENVKPMSENIAVATSPKGSNSTNISKNEKGAETRKSSSKNKNQSNNTQPQKKQRKNDGKTKDSTKSYVKSEPEVPLLFEIDSIPTVPSDPQNAVPVETKKRVLTIPKSPNFATKK